MTNTIKPRVLIEEIHVNKKEWEEELITLGDDELKIGPGIKRLTVDFTAPSFINADLVEFKYFLNGLNEDWSLPTHNRFVSYTNLSPGVYTLEAKAANSDGIWGEPTRLVTFEIVPFFYQTLWFKILSAVFLVLFFLVLFRIRILQLKQRRCNSKIWLI